MTQYRIELRFDEKLLKAVLRLLAECNLRPEPPSPSQDQSDPPPKSEIQHPKSEIQSLLSAFGVEEPALSELATNGLAPEVVRGWILYTQTQELERPAGYLVNRLRAGQTPADVWLTLGRLDEAQQARLRELAGPRKWLGEWDADKLRELDLDTETAEAWYQAHKPPTGATGEGH